MKKNNCCSLDDYINGKSCEKCVDYYDIKIKSEGISIFGKRIMFEKTTYGFSCWSPDTFGCVGAGKTIPETIVNMREAIKFHEE